MPRDGAGVYSRPPGTDAVADTTIDSAKYNTNVADVENDLNLPRPIVAGGTAATSADTALTNLSAEKAKQIVTNWDTTVWRAGSFYAATTATGAAPVAGHAFAGLAYYANATDFVNEAVDLTVPTNPIVYIRMMTAGVWGAWTAIGVGAVRYDAAQTLTAAQKTQARVNIATPLRGQLAGLTLSTVGSSATFGIATGEAADSTVSDLMQLAAAITKTTAAWAVGTGNGALDTGAIAVGTWYHVYLVKRPDTGVVDVLVSLSATTPTLPANYTLFRRIGSMFATGALQWLKFVQIGDKFLWDPIVISYNNVAIGAGVAPLAPTIPPGVSGLTAQFYATMSSTTAGAVISFASSLVTLAGANVPTGNISLISTPANTLAAGQFSIEANTSGQIQIAANVLSNLYLATQGWIDRRGRDA